MINRIIDLLKEKEYTLSELKKELGINNSRILISWLKKIETICKKKGWRLEITPAFCKKCGYKFKKSIKIPSKCPRCKSEWIQEPKFHIVE